VTERRGAVAQTRAVVDPQTEPARPCGSGRSPCPSASSNGVRGEHRTPTRPATTKGGDPSQGPRAPNGGPGMAMYTGSAECPALISEEARGRLRRPRLPKLRNPPSQRVKISWRSGIVGGSMSSGRESTVRAAAAGVATAVSRAHGRRPAGLVLGFGTPMRPPTRAPPRVLKQPGSRGRDPHRVPARARRRGGCYSIGEYDVHFARCSLRGVRGRRSCRSRSRCRPTRIGSQERSHHDEVERPMIHWASQAPSHPGLH